MLEVWMHRQHQLERGAAGVAVRVVPATVTQYARVLVVKRAWLVWKA
jgi:hypothetical protein